jgi:hypothetical protein
MSQLNNTNAMVSQSNVYSPYVQRTKPHSKNQIARWTLSMCTFNALSTAHNIDEAYMHPLPYPINTGQHQKPMRVSTPQPLKSTFDTGTLVPSLYRAGTRYVPAYSVYVYTAVVFGAL